MSLTKEVTIDKIEIVENGNVQVRQVTKIMEDGNELSKSFHRWTIAPGEDYSNQTENVKAICQVTHTPAVIAAYKEYQAQIDAKRLGQ